MLQDAGLALQDFDFYEIHEAFAAQVLCTLKAWESPEFCRDRLGLDRPLGSIDRAKLNVNGSSLAVGHPFAATGRPDPRHARQADRPARRRARADLDLHRRRHGRHRHRRTLAYREAAPIIAACPSQDPVMFTRAKSLRRYRRRPRPAGLRYAPTGPATATASAVATPAAHCRDAPTTKQRLDALFEQYFEDTLQLNPLLATFIGDHRYDDQLPNSIGPEYLAASRAR